jgi:hypothetical protein
MKNKWFASLCVLLVCGFAFIACKDPASDEDESKTGATVTSVTVTAANNATSVAKGGTLQFSVSVTGTNSPAQTVTWSIVETNKKGGTAINASGLLTVATDETLTAITVKATSTVDTSKSNTKRVTVADGSTPNPGGDPLPVANGGDQVYSITEDTFDSDDPYSGDGTVRLVVDVKKEIEIDVGTITKGKLTLTLPGKIDTEYLEPVSSVLLTGVTASSQDMFLLAIEGDFEVYSSESEWIGTLVLAKFTTLDSNVNRLRKI